MEEPLSRQRATATSTDLPRLYLIFDIPQSTLRAGDIARLSAELNELLQAGVRLVQLRAKNLPDADLLEVARALVPIAHASGARMLINTSADICHQTGADGVHRPAHGQSVAALRRAATRENVEHTEILIAISCHSLQTVRAAHDEGADFVTLSPIFPTPSKPGYGPSLGVANLQQICEATQIPIYALAGITPPRAGECLQAGAAGIAVLGGILHAPSPGAAVHQYLHALQPARASGTSPND